MDNQALLNIINDERSPKNVVPYNGKWNRFSGSPVATILLRQILYWDGIKKGKFYKFKEPCSLHGEFFDKGLYKEGDSWCEELGLSRKSFDTAIKLIGFKKGKGSTNRIGATPENSLVVYYRDSSGLTWYVLNRALLGNELSALYLEKCYQDVTKESPISALPITEITPEITPEKKDIYKEKDSDILEKDFNLFWEIYPRKVARKRALESWNKIDFSSILAEDIIKSVKDQSLSEQWQKEGGQFVPHPATWLNQERWTDQPAAPAYDPYNNLPTAEEAFIQCSQLRGGVNYGVDPDSPEWNKGEGNKKPAD